MASGGLDISVSSTCFQKSNIDWPQQPPTEKVRKFNMIFHDSTKKFVRSKHQNKAEQPHFINIFTGPDGCWIIPDTEMINAGPFFY